MLAEGKLREAWMYLRPVGDKAIVAQALAKIEPTDDNVQDLIEIGLHEGVAPALSRRLVLAVRELAAAQQGLSILVCESEFKWARLLAQKVYVIERGETHEEAASDAALAPPHGRFQNGP